MSARKIKRKAPRYPLTTALGPSLGIRGDWKNDQGIGVNWQDVGNCFLLDRPDLIEAIEENGLAIERFPDSEDHGEERLFLYLLTKDNPTHIAERSRGLLADFDRELGDQDHGRAMAELGRKGMMRLIATHDSQKLIVQIDPERAQEIARGNLQ